MTRSLMVSSRSSAILAQYLLIVSASKQFDILFFDFLELSTIPPKLSFDCFYEPEYIYHKPKLLLFLIQLNTFFLNLWGVCHWQDKDTFDWFRNVRFSRIFTNSWFRSLDLIGKNSFMALVIVSKNMSVFTSKSR